MVTGVVLALVLGACPEGCVGTATAAAHREAWIVWEKKARDERSAHQTTRVELDVCRAEAAEAKAETRLSEAQGVSRASRRALAVGAALVGAGAVAVGAGTALDDPYRKPVAIGGLGAVVAGIVTGAITLLLEP